MAVKVGFLEEQSSEKTGRDVEKKGTYRVKDWRAYDRALVSRGSLTFWFDQEEVVQRWEAEKEPRRGRPKAYSDVAIQTCLMLKGLFQLPYRATEGLMKSLMKLSGLNLSVPDHTQMSRRAATVSIKIPRRPQEGGMHVVVDSTGMKIYGEGEWLAKKHGVSKRRTWRKIHLAVDAGNQDIIGIEVTAAEVGDGEVFPDLLAQIDGEIEKVSGDGAYDTRACHEAVLAKGAQAIIPPREGAVPWGVEHPRDAILKEIETYGKKGWKVRSGYHRRSLAETMMYRFKRLGERLYSRTFERQETEVHVRAAILNWFAAIGLPDSEWVGVIAPTA